ncbi:MAG: tripartite tricarboxylate transporter substrate binding protein [Betaproteobacteria bacterium]|nr:tripartite tricarboxylate transporter substrate binding protein [Betaproteobacteria bacterium]
MKILIALAALVVSTVTFAQGTFPDKPIRYIIPFAPGGESDVGARLQGVVFKKKFGQDFIVESKTGAGGALAWSQANTYPGDGYTITSTNLPHLFLQPLEGNVQYKTDDIVNIHFYHYTPDAIVVRAESPYKTYQDLLKAAKEKAGGLNVGGSALNSANHAATERWNAAAGIKSTYVPFKGTADIVASLLGGHVDMAMSYVTLAIAQKGKTRMLAVATEKRHPQFPDTPTFKELGIDWVDGAYRGVSVPKSTPEDIRKKLSSMFSEVNKDPEFRQKMVDLGFELIDVTYDKMPAFMAERGKVYLEVAKRMGLVK